MALYIVVEVQELQTRNCSRHTKDGRHEHRMILSGSECIS